MFLSLAYLPAITVSLLWNLTTVPVAFLGIFALSERLNVLQWAGVVLNLVGVVVYFHPAAFPRIQAVGLVAAAVPVSAQVVLLEPRSWTEVRSLPVPGWEAGSQQEGYLLTVPSGELLASAPQVDQLWLLDPSGDRPPRLLRGGLPGVTGLTLLPDGQALVTLARQNRLMTIRLDQP